MIQPSYSKFQVLAKKGKLVPVYSEFLADLETPVTLFSKLESSSRHAFLFESAEITEKVGRYSFIGINPHGIFELSNNVITVTKEKRRTRINVDSHELVFKALRKLIQENSYIKYPNLPAFLGGLVGFTGYEFVSYCEDIILSKKEGLRIPDSILFLVRTLIIYDHFARKIQIVHLADPSHQKNIKATYQSAGKVVNAIEKQIKSKGPHLRPIVPVIETQTLKGNTLKSNTSKSRFESAVKAAKEYIKAGDCIQTVLSPRFSLGKITDGFSVYRILRTLNPSPYMFYFKHESLKLIGSSPETFVKKQGAFAETRPIAGTRPRGLTDELDQKMEKNLKSSTKETAEHLMLVDLGRNDLGRVCEPKTVKVTEFAKVERYSHVMHLVSNVRGKLKKGVDGLELFKACFPAGTVSGAPKIRAMQIIDELENDRRGPYAGAVGYFDYNGDMDFCITIRTIVILNNHAYIQAGAGIVNDSEPKKEFQETVNKASALLRAADLSRRSGGA